MISVGTKNNSFTFQYKIQVGDKIDTYECKIGVLIYSSNRSFDKVGSNEASDSKKAFNVTPPLSSALPHRGRK